MLGAHRSIFLVGGMGKKASATGGLGCSSITGKAAAWCRKRRLEAGLDDAQQGRVLLAWEPPSFLLQPAPGTGPGPRRTHVCQPCLAPLPKNEGQRPQRDCLRAGGSCAVLLCAFSSTQRGCVPTASNAPFPPALCKVQRHGKAWLPAGLTGSAVPGCRHVPDCIGSGCNGVNVLRSSPYRVLDL